MTTFTGTSGNDTIGAYSGYGAYTVYGGAGNDSITGYTDSDYLLGEDGNDTIVGWFGNDTILGGAGDDVIRGWDNNDYINGGDGNDVITGDNNNDTILGGAGNDVIYGDYGSTSGSDVLAGGTGNDDLYGGADNDTYLFNFYSDGQDYIIDSQGSYDELDVGGVQNLSSLTIKHASVIGHSSNNLLIYTDADAADGSLSEYVEIFDYFAGSSYGTGDVEQIRVNGSSFSLHDVIDNSLLGTA